MHWELSALGAGGLALIAAAGLHRWVTSQENGSKEMTEFSSAVQKGSQVYLRRLFQALMWLIIPLALLILLGLGPKTALAYILGALSSGAAAYVGMLIATKANAKVAWAARSGIAKAFPIGFYGGAVMGLSVVGFALLGMTALYMVFRDPGAVLGFSFGASSVALLAKAGGGIYTKTADIGADLVGKVEFSLEEDDPRNPAVIADNVGDNVGDVAGMGADIFDSYVASVVAVMLLGAALYSEKYVLYPLALGAAGILSSLIGMAFVRTGEGTQPTKALNAGTLATTVLFSGATVGVTFLFGMENPWGLIIPAIAGLGAGIIIGLTSDYFTSIDRKSVKDTADSAQTGPAILIIRGFSYGLVSTVPAILGISAAMVISWGAAQRFGVAGTYGVSIAAVGMLSITGMVMSADAYGPIVDNAKGCAEAALEDQDTIRVCDQLDAAGNTAKAITKGFAIGAAALTVLALFSAYAETAGISVIDLRNPEVVVGVFIGAMMPPLFSALTLLSVSRNAFLMVEEIRRQFAEIPGLVEGRTKPDSERCIDIATRGALRELVAPGLLSFLTPVAVGFILGKNALGGFLAGSIVTGIIFALFMANSGGLWDNAKKYIEDGAYGGPGSPAHKAAVVGDTVGDPFKDTAGPSINTLITVMCLAASLIAPLLTKTTLFRF